MKKLLVINSGSSSLKMAVFSGSREIWRGLVDQIGGRSRLIAGRSGQAVTSRRKISTVAGAFAALDHWLTRQHISPDTVAHRIVHGGDIFFRPTRLTLPALNRLKKFVSLAPLHMPANLTAVRLSRRAWPAVPQWGVFDTAPYHDLPEHARLYAIPTALAKRWHIRKYGFHGISHHWAMIQAAKKLHRRPTRLNLVTIHLGAGDSMTLWRQGRAVDTTMGFTPLEGLTMSTRSGDLDPMIPLWLQRRGYKLGQVINILEQRSGLFGLTGLRDMREILSAAGHPIPDWPPRRWSVRQRRQAKLAIGLFVYDIQRYLSSYIGLVDKLMAIVFTGAIGQNRFVQRQILSGLPAARHQRVMTVPTDEERAIAETVAQLID